MPEFLGELGHFLDFEAHLAVLFARVRVLLQGVLHVQVQERLRRVPLLLSHINKDSQSTCFPLCNDRTYLRQVELEDLLHTEILVGYLHSVVCKVLVVVENVGNAAVAVHQALPQRPLVPGTLHRRLTQFWHACFFV